MNLNKVLFTEEFEDAVPVCSHAGQMAEGWLYSRPIQAVAAAFVNGEESA